MFVHTVIMVIEPHMKQGRQHKLISTIFLATSVTKKLDHNKHTQYDTQSLAKFAFSMFWRAMRFAEEQQVPILLDY